MIRGFISSSDDELDGGRPAAVYGGGRVAGRPATGVDVLNGERNINRCISEAGDKDRGTGDVG